MRPKPSSRLILMLSCSACCHLQDLLEQAEETQLLALRFLHLFAISTCCPKTSGGAYMKTPVMNLTLACMSRWDWNIRRHDQCKSVRWQAC